MSALGHKQTFGRENSTSTLPPKADIGTLSRNVCFVPKADISRFFRLLVGEPLERGWHAQAQGFGGFEIDGEFEFGRKLHW
jgi:hypothetical protein